MKESSGVLVYRKLGNNLEVLLVHASGEGNVNHPWSIAKGLLDEGETPEITAPRELREEAGLEIKGVLISLGDIIQGGKKKVHCFTIEDTRRKEPHPASWEVDKAEFVRIETAYQLMHPDQRVFLDRLKKHLGV